MEVAPWIEGEGSVGVEEGGTMGIEDEGFTMGTEGGEPHITFLSASVPTNIHVLPQAATSYACVTVTSWLVSFIPSSSSQRTSFAMAWLYTRSTWIQCVIASNKMTPDCTRAYLKHRLTYLDGTCTVLFLL